MRNRRFKPYTNYKASGVEWLGEIAERLYFCVHGHAKVEDARAIRDETRRWKVRAIPSLQHAPGD